VTKYYNIIPARRLPIKVLTYSSKQELEEGSIVEVPIKNKNEWGLVLSEAIQDNIYDTNKIKEVKSITPFKFNHQHINFLKLFSTNTFNQINLCLNSYFQPLYSLPKKEWKNIEPITHKDRLDGVYGKVDFLLDIDITVRIMYLIRNVIYKNNINKKILIIFPEKKYLNKIYSEIKNYLKDNPEIISKINFHFYSGDKTKSAKSAVLNLLKTEKNENNTTDIFLSTRNGIFLPFQELTEIIMVDEANSMYIQDQNSIYFDAREAVFLLSKAFNANLTFISTLPSIRLYSFYSEKVLQEYMNQQSINDLKPLKIKLSKLEAKSANFNLFSESVYEHLEEEFGGEKNLGVFEG
jgi:primosomal protein N'